MKMSELKPCPFCGGEASIERVGANRVSMKISCKDCGCSVESSETWINENSQWNTRAENKELTTLREQNKELIKALELTNNLNAKVINHHNSVNPPWDSYDMEHCHDNAVLIAKIKGGQDA